MLHEHVRQEQRERLMTDQFTRTPNRMPKPERLLLTREAGGAGAGQVFVQQFERLLFLPLQERHFQLELAVEMILDNAFVASGDEYEMFDAGLAGLVDNVLDQWPVDDGQHLFRHGLGGWQEPGAEPGDGENSLADRCHTLPLGRGPGERMRDALLPESLLKWGHA